MSKARVIAALTFALLVCSILCLTPARAQTANKRLILKDGSYQIVTQYKALGDRVRYFSAERAQWEELPANMVDWQATDKWAKDHAPGANVTGANVTGPSGTSAADSEAAAIDKEEQEARAEQAARTPEVLPGLRLPDDMGVWALDTFRAQPELVKLVQNSGNLNPRTGHNITRGELSSSGGLKQTIQFPGAVSKVQLHVDQPVFYVSLTVTGGDAGAESLSEPLTVDTHGAPPINPKDSYSSPSSQYVIVGVQNNMRRDYRLLSGFSLNPNGTASPSGSVIPTKAQILPGKHWMKLTPSTSLNIGDYALLEILTPGEVNLSLWDFRVDPQGPDNMDAIMPLQRSPQ